MHYFENSNILAGKYFENLQIITKMYKNVQNKYFARTVLLGAPVLFTHLYIILLFLDVVVAAPLVYLDYVNQRLRPDIKVVAQNCWTAEKGAFTGETR